MIEAVSYIMKIRKIFVCGNKVSRLLVENEHDRHVDVLL